MGLDFEHHFLAMVPISIAITHPQTKMTDELLALHGGKGYQNAGAVVYGIRLHCQHLHLLLVPGIHEVLDVGCLEIGVWTAHEHWV